MSNLSHTSIDPHNLFSKKHPSINLLQRAAKTKRRISTDSALKLLERSGCATGANMGDQTVQLCAERKPGNLSIGLKRREDISFCIFLNATSKMARKTLEPFLFGA